MIRARQAEIALLFGMANGVATLVRRGRELCHVNGMLQQDGKDIAWAVALCKVVET